MAVVKWPVIQLLALFHVAAAVGWASDPLKKGPPRVVGKPQRHVAKLGKNTKLVCPVEDESPLLTQWRKDGEIIDDDRIKVTNKGHLRIHDVQWSDAGIYMCSAFNGFGGVDVNNSVVVLDEENRMVQQQGDKYPQSPHEDLTKEWMAPVFKNLKDPEVMSPKGSTVQLRCRAKGNPEPQVTWWKGDKIVQQSDSRRRPHYTLKLPRVQQSDSGQYTCVVSNRLGQLNYTYTLDVIDQVISIPKISQHPKNTTVEYGGTASFQCRVKSIVEPHIKWLKRIKDTEAHLYNKTIDVKGQKFIVLLTAKGVWNDGSYLSKLVIHRATSEDAGMYICLGANSMGFNFTSVHLHVVPAIQRLPSSSTESSFSNNLPLFIGVPAGAVIILVILAILLLQNRRRCNASRAALKRHRLPVPTQDRDAFYNTYHHSPATTNTVTMGGGTVTSSSNTANMHTNSLQLSREKVPKTPAPSLDFGSDISSVSHSHSHPQHPHLHQHLQQQQQQPPMHFMVNPHSYGY